jgi:hypothetical protein
MAWWNQAFDGDIFADVLDLRAAQQLGSGNQDIIGGMKADKGSHVVVSTSIN